MYQPASPLLSLYFTYKQMLSSNSFAPARAPDQILSASNNIFFNEWALLPEGRLFLDIFSACIFTFSTTTNVLSMSLSGSVKRCNLFDLSP